MRTLSERLVAASWTITRIGKVNTTTSKSLADRWCDTLIELDRRDRTGTPTPDGYPRGRGDGTTGRSFTDDGKPDSPVANLAAALADDTIRARDDVHELSERLSSHFLEAAAHLKALEEGLKLLDTITTPRRPIGRTVPTCSTVGGHEQLTEIPCTEEAIAKGLCRQCYDRLRAINATRAEDGLPERTALTKAEADDLFATRTKRKRYQTGPHAEPDTAA